MAATFLLLATLLCRLGHALGKYECCSDENVVSRDETDTLRCPNNSSLSLACKKDETQFPIQLSALAEVGITINEEGNLEDSGSVISESYCQTKMNKSDEPIYVMCYGEDEDFQNTKLVSGAILSYVSVFFIILTIVVYASIPQLLDLQGVCILHSLFGLGLGYVFLSTIQLETGHGEITCSVLAFLTYTFLLYAFFWLNTLSFHIWRTTTALQIFSNARNWVRTYYIFAIGGTILCLTIVLLAQYTELRAFEHIKPRIGVSACWFQSLRETFIYFYGPISVLIVLNMIYFVWTVVVLWKAIDNRNSKALKYRLKLCLKLSVIMGLTWIFEMITAAMKTQETYLIMKILFTAFDVLNIMQGLLIFLVLVVFRKRVRRALASKGLCNLRFPSSWRFLEDDENEEEDEDVDVITTVEFHKNGEQKHDDNANSDDLIPKPLN
ncbi:G-protein coupled receptor Mth2-like [Cylas formicarius]|uniref:G-protein coupled receptor Mth2-like n=1 Tax=Cylas formicarius TaxID=197179 RepID=UPI002958B839|nr:G-protein coupled receptor Mth2-like [Cylas formicarius]XP_060536475.1 G-protein coupled receptor Mth2-like [Cylas formicarius]